MKNILLILMIFSTSCYSEDTRSEILCLAKNIYFEARGEEKEGMISVSNVVINRVKSEKFPNNICAVIYQSFNIPVIKIPIPFVGCQFSWYCDHISNLPKDEEEWEKIQKIAKEIYNNQYTDLTDGATHYFNPKLANPRWAKSKYMVKTKKIGNHIFYKYK